MQYSAKRNLVEQACDTHAKEVNSEYNSFKTKLKLAQEVHIAHVMGAIHLLWV